MICSIEIQKFKRFKKRIRIEGLASVNYLVGKNNSGKSSFLQAVLLACLYRNDDGSGFLNPRFPENLAAYREYYSNEDISSPIKVVLTDEKKKRILIEGSWINDSSAIRKKSEGEGKIPRVLYIPCNVQISKTEDRATLRDVDSQIQGLGILPVNNIASWVYHQEKNSVGGTWNRKPSEKFASFQRIVNDEFQVEILPPEISNDNQFYFKYRESKRQRSLYLVGSGAQNVIYFTAAIVYLNDYDLMLVDEPELHLHPEIQKKLGGLFRRLSKRFDVQFVIATQSPFLISDLTGGDNVYLLKSGAGGTVTKEDSYIKVAVSMELGSEPSDVGAPENFVLVEEASMQAFLRIINDRFYGEKPIQFISCGGINRVPDKETAIQNIIDHNLLLKCTPVYLSKYFVVTDKLTETIRTNKRVLDMQKKLDGRFIEMRFETLEAAYPDKYLEDFIVDKQKVFDRIEGTNTRQKISNWLGEKEQAQGERGKRKYSLAQFVGEVITKEDFEEIFRELLIIFE